MKMGAYSRGSVVIITLAFLLCMTVSLECADVSRGNIIGFLYGEDGTTPVAGAVLKARNVSTGTVYESSISDVNGVFKIEGIEKGVYIYGVKTPEGNFNSSGLFGLNVNASHTAKMAIALTPFDKKVLTDLAEGAELNSIKGETAVGRVLDFDPESRIAEVYVLQKGISQKDRIHTLGVETDFYQKVSWIEVEGVRVKNATVGQMAMVELKKDASKGDFIYLVADKGFALLSFVPIGVAALVGTSAAVIEVDKATVNDQEEAASPYKE